MKYDEIKEESNKILLEVKDLLSNDSYSIQLLIDKLDGLDINLRTYVINQLGAHYFSEDLSKQIAKEMFKEQPAQAIKRFFDYLISIKYFSDERDFIQNRIFEVIPEKHKKDVLVYYFTTESLMAHRTGAILANTEEGAKSLVDIINDENRKELHFKAALALCENLISDIADRYVVHEWYPTNSQYGEYIPAILKKLVAFPDEKISYLATKTLFHSSLLSLDELVYVLQSNDKRKILLGLRAFERLRINVNTSKYLFPIVVELLEHKDIAVSETSTQVVKYISNNFSDEVAEIILDLLVLRSSKRPQEFFNAKIVASALTETFKFNPRLQGQVLHKLRDLAIQNIANTRSRAVFTGIALNKREFLALVNELNDTNPNEVNSIAGIVSGNQKNIQILNEISETDPSDIQKNAANQISLLTNYYESGLAQARSSFNWAIGISVSCIFMFFVVIWFFGQNEDKTAIWVSGGATAITQLIAGSLLFIYQKSLVQLNKYNQQMSKIQDYLLANSFIEGLSENAKDNARIELIKNITTKGPVLDTNRL